MLVKPLRLLLMLRTATGEVEHGDSVRFCELLE